MASRGQWNPTSREKRARCGAPVDTWLRQSFATRPRPVLIRIYYWNLLLSILLLLSPLTLAGQTAAQTALTSALQSTPAVGLVVDVKTGRQLASVKATNERHAPGSILKPLFLAAALEQHIVLPETTVFCRRNLHISDGTRDWNLACTHPQSDVAFAAKEALAYSCNRYFAELADRIPPAQVAAILEDPATARGMGERALARIGRWSFEQDICGLRAALAHVTRRLSVARE